MAKKGRRKGNKREETVGQSGEERMEREMSSGTKKTKPKNDLRNIVRRFRGRRQRKHYKLCGI